MPKTRLTQYQWSALKQGLHPLSLKADKTLPLHNEAAPKDDPAASGRRCGNCLWAKVLPYWSDSQPKCAFGGAARMSHSAATDLQDWWPGCRDHRYLGGAADT